MFRYFTPDVKAVGHNESHHQKHLLCNKHKRLVIRPHLALVMSLILDKLQICYKLCFLRDRSETTHSRYFKVNYIKEKY